MQQLTSLIIPLLILGIISYGLLKGIAAVNIMPYLVAMLFAIAIFRASGALDFLLTLLSPVADLFGFPAEVISMGLIRPLTGSGSVGVLSELIVTYGEDSIIVKIAAVMFGSTETTLYVLAVYFGAINIKKTQYAIQAGLMADFAGFIAAITVTYWYFS